MAYRKTVEERLVLRLSGAHHLGDIGDLEPKASHALGLTDHGEDLGVKVHKQLLGLWVAHQQ